MKRIASLLSVAALSFTVVGCSDSMSPAAPSSTSSVTEEARGNSGNSNGRSSLPTIAGTAVAEGFNTLVYAPGKAGLVGTLSGSRQFTVLAPTDAAFGAAAQAFGLANGQALVDYLDENGLLAQVLTYHVAVGDGRAQEVLSSGQVFMLDGNAAAITVDVEGTKIAGAIIEKTDIIASNRVIHVLGFVMLPPGFLD